MGYDLIPHFCEKLFAGPMVRHMDVLAFHSLGLSHPLLLVYLAGLIEFLGSLAISCGLLVRLSAISLVLYFCVATYLGHHFLLGFIWASPGGGWEFPMLWSVIILSFAITKPMLLTLDEVILTQFKLPKLVRKVIEY